MVNLLYFMQTIISLMFILKSTWGSLHTFTFELFIVKNTYLTQNIKLM